MVAETDLQRRAALPLLIEVDPHLDPYHFVATPQAIPWKTEDGETHAICEVQDGFPRILLPNIGIIHVVDDVGNVRGIVAKSEKISVMEEVYYRFALPMILQAAGAEMLHASAIRAAKGVIAFCGPSGTGKSTLAYALSRQKYPHWADDSVVFFPRDNAFEALRLPFRPRVEIASSSAVEFISGTESGPLVAIAILGRHPGGFVASDQFHAEVKRFSAADAFRAIVPHIFSFVLSDRQRNALMMARYFDIAARLPLFDVRFTPCLDALPRLCNIVEASCLSNV